MEYPAVVLLGTHCQKCVAPNRRVSVLRFTRFTLLIALLGTMSGITPATAESPSGHYHPDDIAGASKVFASAAESVGPRYEAASQTIQKVGSGLELLELGALTMGTRTSSELKEWMDASRRRAAGEHLRLQRHVDLMGEDYSTEFGAALNRTLQKQAPASIKNTIRRLRVMST